MPYVRFLDRQDKQKLIDECPDFVKRRYGMSATPVLYSFIALMVFLIYMAVNISIRMTWVDDSDPVTVQEISGYIVAIGIFIIVIAILSYVVINRIIQKVTEAEFQNLLFASAARLDTEFCLLANSNFGVAYFDESYGERFNIEGDGTDVLFNLLEYEGLGKAEAKKISTALESGRKTTVNMDYKPPRGKTAKWKVVVEPLARPSGYCVIRGVKA